MAFSPSGLPFPLAGLGGQSLSVAGGTDLRRSNGLCLGLLRDERPCTETALLSGSTVSRRLLICRSRASANGQESLKSEQMQERGLAQGLIYNGPRNG